MPLVVITLGILLLFLLILVVRLNAFIAFILVGLAIGIGQGMELNSIVQSIEKGIGNTLGFLVMILGLGAMLGNAMEIKDNPVAAATVKTRGTKITKPTE